MATMVTGILVPNYMFMWRAEEGWREEIQNRNRLLNFGGKTFQIEIDSSFLAGRHSKYTHFFGGKSGRRLFWREEKLDYCKKVRNGQ